MKHCNSVTLKGAQCRGWRILFSRYCWRHQDYAFGIAILSIVATIVVAICVAVYQNRYPVLSARCQLVDNEDPCVLICSVTNSGRAEARDTYVSFNKLLPLETVVIADPAAALELVDAQKPPNPNQYGKLSLTQKAFAVRIPRIAAGDTVVFEVRTTHPDNLRAGKQLQRLQKEVVAVLEQIEKRLSVSHPDEATEWNSRLISGALVKRQNFFTPGKLSYEAGRMEIEFFTGADLRALAISKRLTKQLFADVQKNTELFAPVLRIRTMAGESTTAMLIPYIITKVEVNTENAIKEYHASGEGYAVPSVPEEY